MLTIEQARKIVNDSLWIPDPVKLPLDFCSGLILAEDIKSDMDIPPFNKATMDGYAILSSDSGEGAELKVDAVLVAGDYYDQKVKRGHAVKIMTGAPMPDGADTVIQVELTSEPQPGFVKLKSRIEAKKNIAWKGEEIKKGSVILRKGTEISAPVAAILAQAGQAQVPVYPRPSVIILSTGSELVEVNETPELGQIRESNSYGLLAQCDRWGAAASRRPMVSDRKSSLTGAITDALELNPDILILTGGVSAGDLDLVPGIMKKLGVKILFHQVAQKPGKPMLFGKKDETLVFGLPGNPVAAFNTFEMYVGPAIRRMIGEHDFEINFLSAIADKEFKVKSDRTWIPQAKVKNTNDEWRISPVKSMGSADIFSVVGTNALAIFEAGNYTINAGEKIKFFFQRGEGFGT